MKKIFSTCLMAMAMATMSAADLTYSAYPDPSTPQTSLQEIVISVNSTTDTFTSIVNASDIFVLSDSDVTYNTSCNVDTGDLSIFIKNGGDPITSAGTYSLIIGAGAVTINNVATTAPITFEYTIEGEDGSNPYLESQFPEVGETLDYISAFFILNKMDGELVILEESGIYLLDPNWDMVPLEVENMGFGIQIMPENEDETEYVTLTDPGEYMLIFDPGSLGLQDEEGNVTTIEENIIFTYTVGTAEIDYSSLPFDVYPAVNSSVSSLDKIILEPNQELGYAAIYADDPTYNWRIIDEDGNTYPFSVEESEEDTYIIVTPTEPITNPGTYTLQISYWSLTVTGNGNRYLNEKTLSLPFIVTGGIANPYDVPFEIAYPSASEIEGWTNFELDILPDSGYTSFVVKNPDGIYYTKDGKFYSKVNIDGWGNEWYFDTVVSVTSSGEYALVIEEDALGWTNESETETVYNTEKMVFSVKVVIDNVPEVAPFTLNPADDATVKSLSTITFTFDSEYTDTSLTADYMFFTDPNNNYLEFSITKDAANENIHTLTLATEATAAGTYTLAINPRGVTYYENGSRIRNSQAFIYTFTVGDSSAVESISVAPVVEGVYNLMGVKVAETTENLPAGIYIVNGKKVVVK